MSSSQQRHTTSEHSVGSTSLHQNILRELRTDDVFEKYELVQTLGEGSMGAVAKVRIKPDKVGGSAFQPKKPARKGLFGFGLIGLFDKKKKKTSENNDNNNTARSLSSHSSDHMYALKSIILDRVSPLFLEELRNEIKILRSLDHPNIVKAHEVYSVKKQIYVVLELCDGGDLYTRAPYTERQCGKHVSCILSAIRYMHEHGVVHRDLKHENIMFSNCSPEAQIKVIDFGLSKKFLGQKPGYMQDRVGTIYTMAPQVLQGLYSSQADLWSTGVIAYMLLSSSKPFYHRRRRVMIDMIMRGSYDFEKVPTWQSISDDAKDFVSKLLVVDPKARLNAEQALEHTWIQNREQLPDELPSPEALSKIEDSLLNYRHTSELKKLALTVIAHRSSQKEIMNLRQVFEKYDKSRDGVISFVEFQEALKDLDYSEETLNEIFESLDVNQNGHIMYTEFLAGTIEAHGHVEEDRIAEAFDRIDSDDSGFISRENLVDFLGKGCPSEQVDAIIESADKNKDGQISYDEFLAAFRMQTEFVADSMARIDTSSMHESDSELLGLDAKIPGGKE